MLRFAAVAAVLLVGATAVHAQETEHPRRGPYATLALGPSTYQQDPGILFCLCSERDNATAFKVGGGYRFGVTSLEALLVDYGKADYSTQTSGPGSTSRARALVLGPMWSARFGSSFEASWRVGVSFTRISGNDIPTRTVHRLAAGYALGWWLTPTTAVEFQADLTRGRTGVETPVELTTRTIGLRQRF